MRSTLALSVLAVAIAPSISQAAQAGTAACSPDSVADWLGAGHELLMQCQAGDPHAASAAVLALEGPCACGKTDACIGLAVALQWCAACAHGRERAMALYEQACAKNDPVACLNLGMSVEMASKSTRDAAMLAEARRLYEAACAGKEPAGCAFAGAMLLPLAGQGGRAARMLSLACESGEATACNQLLEAYALEMPGVPRDAAAEALARGRACLAGVDSACDRGTEARATDE